jgi:hypothetical protein
MNISQLERIILSLKEERETASKLLSAAVNLRNYKIIANHGGESRYDVDLTCLIRDESIEKAIKDAARKRFDEVQKKIQDFEEKFSSHE